jgi:hypothetical protein
MTHPDMLSAEITQARRIAVREAGEKESYARVVAILARAILNQTPLPIVGNVVCVHKADFETVGKSFNVRLVPRVVKDEEKGEDAKEEPVLAIEVHAKEQRPRLVVAQEVVKPSAVKP